MQTPADTTIALLDTTAAQTAAVPVGSEAYMLAADKLPVVAAVMLVVWIGIVALLFTTERRLARVEQALDAAEDARADSVRS